LSPSEAFGPSIPICPRCAVSCWPLWVPAAAAALKLGASVGGQGPRKVIKVVGFMGLFHGEGGMGME